MREHGEIRFYMLRLARYLDHICPEGT